MLQWYKNPSDTAMPSKKSDKLARYHQICNRGDPPEPELLPLPPLPTPQLATASTDDAVPDLSLLDDNSSTLSDLEDNEICNRGDPPEPELLPLPPLPTPQLATASTDDAVPDLSLLDDNSSTLSDLEDNELLMRINEMLTSATEV
jgi:hypothetical protein